MDHSQLRDRVFFLYDGELPPAERPSVEAHLAGCADCARTLERWKRLSGRLLRPEKVEPSPAFAAGVLARLESASEPALHAGSWRLWLAPAFGLAFAAALFLLPSAEPVSGSDSLLLADGREEVQTQWAAGLVEPRADDLLEFALGVP